MQPFVFLKKKSGPKVIKLPLLPLLIPLGGFLAPETFCGPLETPRLGSHPDMAGPDRFWVFKKKCAPPKK